MSRKAVLIGSLLLFGLSPTGLSAQGSGCTTRIIAVGVVDSAWNLLPNLSAANFHTKLHGHDVQIVSATIDKNPRQIAVLLDASGSMMEPTSQGWNTAKSLAEYISRYGPSQASVTLMAFSVTVVDMEAPAQGPHALMENLHALVNKCEPRLRKGGQTALYDAIASARGALGVPGLGDVIYVLTDGGDNRSETKQKKVGQELVRAGFRLFAAVMTEAVADRARTPEEAEGPHQLHSVVDLTGGVMLTLPLDITSPAGFYHDAKTRQAALDLALRRLFEQMGEFYRLDVRLPETVDKPTKWKLEVVNSDGKPIKGVEVHYPQELMPCANASP